jgi:hypothetical protein
MLTQLLAVCTTSLSKEVKGECNPPLSRAHFNHHPFSISKNKRAMLTLRMRDHAHFVSIRP